MIFFFLIKIPLHPAKVLLASGTQDPDFMAKIRRPKCSFWLYCRIVGCGNGVFSRRQNLVIDICSPDHPRQPRKRVLEGNSPTGDVQILQAAPQGYLFSLLPRGTNWIKFPAVPRNPVSL